MIGVDCSYKECRVPPERHGKCAASGLGKCVKWLDLQHQHVPKRSQGGRAAVVMLCAGHHGCIDSGERYEGMRLQNDIRAGVYRILDRTTGETLRETVL